MHPKCRILDPIRMLLIGHVTLGLIDGIDEEIKSGRTIGNPIGFLLYANLIA
ncbi:hypothetical protein NHP164001_06120 [Helicobacter trogontum]|uniref:Uncharacterized protein n=1 Tax=Helicobacter trogontum TaxID=50960 RepID=A0ABQ0D352_9HELI